uniref:hypothetical protein n=1 Tax=uncultured Sphingomonas sp. TaxID=158754 RepID=UPI0035CB0D2B
MPKAVVSFNRIRRKLRVESSATQPPLARAKRLTGILFGEEKKKLECRSASKWDPSLSRKNYLQEFDFLRKNGSRPVPLAPLNAVLSTGTMTWLD